MSNKNKIMQPDELLELVINSLEDSKGLDVVNMSVYELTDIADYMVVCSGTSGRHVNSIAENLVKTSKDNGIQPLGEEKDPNGTWTLVDLGDIIVHVMQPQTREFYDLEHLWSAAHKNRQKEL